MWKATIESKGFNDGKFFVLVKYADGTNAFQEQVTLSDKANLDAVVRTRLKVLETIHTFANSVSLGAFTPQGELKESDEDYKEAVRSLAVEYTKL